MNGSQLKFFKRTWPMSHVEPNTPLFQLGHDHLAIEKLLGLGTEVGKLESKQKHKMMQANPRWAILRLLLSAAQENGRTELAARPKSKSNHTNKTNKASHYLMRIPLSTSHARHKKPPNWGRNCRRRESTRPRWWLPWDRSHKPKK
jgi:hypothetical protein